MIIIRTILALLGDLGQFQFIYGVFSLFNFYLDMFVDLEIFQ